MGCMQPDLLQHFTQYYPPSVSPFRSTIPQQLPLAPPLHHLFPEAFPLRFYELINYSTRFLLSVLQLNYLLSKDTAGNIEV